MQAQFDATSNVVTELVRKLCTEADQPCVLVPVPVPVLVPVLVLVLVPVLVLVLLPLPLLVCVCCSRLPSLAAAFAQEIFLSLCWEVPPRLTRRALGGA